jgi:hypothetical protein
MDDLSHSGSSPHSGLAVDLGVSAQAKGRQCGTGGPMGLIDLFAVGCFCR